VSEEKRLHLDWEHHDRTGEASADLVCFGDSSPIRIRVRHGVWLGFGRWLAMIDVSRVYAYRTEAICPDILRAERVPDAVLAEAEAWAFGNLRVCGGQST
jgi:hypothetical protein